MNLTRPITKGERTRSHIVAVAAGLFWRRSFHSVSVDIVAAAANVNKATVYRYFADKKDLSLAVIRYHGELVLREVFEQNFAHHSRPDARLAAIFHNIYCAHQTAKNENDDLYGCPILGLALELGQEMPELRREAQEIFEKVEGYLRVIAGDAIALHKTVGTPEMLARTLTQLLHGGFASARISSEPQRILDAGHASLALIGFPSTTIPTTHSQMQEQVA